MEPEDERALPSMKSKSIKNNQKNKPTQSRKKEGGF